MNYRSLTTTVMVMLTIGLIPINMEGQGKDNGEMGIFTETVHSPISISGNSQFGTRAATEGWSGDGSSIDPYIISNYRIHATGDHCISISNTDVHFVIRNCNLSGADVAGVLLSAVLNGRIEFNTITQNEGDGVRLINSGDNVVDNNTMDMEMVYVMNYNGIHLMGSSDNIITGNNIHLSVNDAIRLVDGSGSNIISGNHMEENSNNAIYLEGDDNIVSENTMFSNKVGVLVDSSYNVIRNNKLKKDSWGIDLHSGRSNKVRNNIIDRNAIGIQIYNSDDNEIVGNWVLKCYSFGIESDHASSSGNIIHTNSFFYNNGSGSFYDSTKRQGKDLSGNTIWKSGSNTGNYWHDWRSPDSDANGIVDSPYPLRGGENTDPFPLTDSEIPDVFAPPKRLTAQPGKDHINLTWWPMNYGKGIRTVKFNIYKGERGGGEFYYRSTPAEQWTFTDYDVLPGLGYWYYVTAVTEISESNISNRVKSSPDTKSPTIKIDAPADLAVINATDVSVKWTGVDNIAIDRFEIDLDGEGAFSIDLNDFYIFRDLTEGEHTATVTIFDMAEHNRSDSVTFIIDRTPPEVGIESYGQDPILFNTTEPVIYWSASDTGPGIDRFEYSMDGINWTWIGRTYSQELPELEEGLHHVHIKCVDLAGNWKIDIAAILVDPTPPLVSIIEPLGAGYSAVDRVLMKYNGSDQLTEISSYWVRIDTGNWISKGLEREHRFYDLLEGLHHIYVMAEDRAGNRNIASTTMTVDSSPPELEILNLKDGALYNQPVTLEWYANDAISGIATHEVRVDGEEWRIYGEPKPLLLEFFQDGEHLIEIIIRDNVGNFVERSLNIRFDVTSPQVTSAEPRDSEVPVNSSITVTFSEPMDKDTIRIDIPGVSGALGWSGERAVFLPDDPLEYNTKYSIAVQGKDLAGNDLIPFDWFFLTEIDLSEHMGRVMGRVVDTDGIPIPGASFRFKTGERGTCDEDGTFEIYVKTGKNNIIVSNSSYRDTKVDFEVKEGETENLGDIPLKSVREAEVEEEGKTSYMPVIIVAIVILMIIALGGGIALQVKRTRDYSKMEFENDEWVNVTQISGSPPNAPPVALKEGIQGDLGGPIRPGP
jgi:parallel beta-helix repeat protein